jgi:simple sugar transport system permease protein
MPTQVFQVAPFALMIFVLALVNGASNPAVVRWAEELPPALGRPLLRMISRLGSQAPAALGAPFQQP